MVVNYSYPNSYPNYIQSPQPFNAGLQTSSMQGGPMQKFLKGRPVSCFQEAQGFAIDMDGSLHIFPDIANKKIYTKQMLNDGSCPVKCYVEQQIPINTPSQVEEPVSNKKLEEIQNKVAMLEQQLKGLIENDTKSNATVPNVRTA